jgi:tryptophan-specific transport protein
MSSLNAEQSTKTPATLGGIMIIAGTSIGAGMFSLPVSSAGIWFGWTVALLGLVAFCLYSSGLYLCEVALKMPLGAHYTSMAQKTIGRKGYVLALLSVGFVSYILTYAYISGGSSVIQNTFPKAELTGGEASAAFAVVLGLTVFLVSHFVDKITTMMLGGMVFTFFSTFAGLSHDVTAQKLFPELAIADNYIYIGTVLPILVLSFGFHTAVPSLMMHFKQKHHQVIHSIRYGTLITAAVYITWITVVFGLSNQNQIAAVISQGGNIGNIVNLLQSASTSANIELFLHIFSNLAIASSFLGVSLGLFDFVKDLLKWQGGVVNRLKTAAVTFLPPSLLAIAYPDGFLSAISYAGLIATFFLIILPCWMAINSRQKLTHEQGQYRVSGGLLRLYAILFFGCFVAGCQFLNMFGLLPQFS